MEASGTGPIRSPSKHGPLGAAQKNFRIKVEQPKNISLPLTIVSEKAVQRKWKIVARFKNWLVR